MRADIQEFWFLYIVMYMAFTTNLNGSELIRLYDPYINRNDDRYALVKSGGVYRVIYEPETRTVKIGSNSRKFRLGSYWHYEIELAIGVQQYNDPVRCRWNGGHYWTATVGRPGADRSHYSHRQRVPLPLRGYFLHLESWNEDAFDELVREQGYTLMCKSIDEVRFPDLFRTLLTDQARREVVSNLRHAFLVFRYSAMSAVPRELVSIVAKYVELYTSPDRGVGRILS
jgi:hypothetical protein